MEDINTPQMDSSFSYSTNAFNPKKSISGKFQLPILLSDNLKQLSWNNIAKEVRKNAKTSQYYVIMKRCIVLPDSQLKVDCDMSKLLHCVYSSRRHLYPPMEGTFALDHPQQCDFHSMGCLSYNPHHRIFCYLAWLGAPWREYFDQKRCCTIILCRK